MAFLSKPFIPYLTGKIDFISLFYSKCILLLLQPFLNRN